MINVEVAEGVRRLGAPLVSWFLVEGGDRLTLIDAGTPAQYDELGPTLASLGRSVTDIDAIVLTHAHGDHLGSSARIRDVAGAEVWIEKGDESLVQGQAVSEHERSIGRDLRHLQTWKTLLFFRRSGARHAVPVADPSTFSDGEVLDVPGRPRVVHTPGHTDGSSCFELADRGVVFTGDALVTFSITTGETGPRIMPGSFNKDSRLALESLGHLSHLDADLVLPGHGDPWRGDIDDAVRAARRVGPT